MWRDALLLEKPVLAEKDRLPAMRPCRDYVDAGGLMAYTVDLAELFGRLAACCARAASWSPKVVLFGALLHRHSTATTCREVGNRSIEWDGNQGVLQQGIQGAVVVRRCQIAE